MEAAIDYAEAFRGAKDLVKLAKLTKQEVLVSTKEKGKPESKRAPEDKGGGGQGAMFARLFPGDVLAILPPRYDTRG